MKPEEPVIKWKNDLASMLQQSFVDGDSIGKELLEVGRKAIEDTLIKWRDARLSQMLRGNGFVVKEKDGSASSIIRFGPEDGLRIAIMAIIKHLQKELV